MILRNHSILYRLTSIRLWSQLTGTRLEAELSQNERLREVYTSKSSESFDDFLPRLIFVTKLAMDLNAPNTSSFLQQVVDLFLEFLVQVPTRRYLTVLLDDHQLDVFLRNYGNTELADVLRSFLNFPIDALTYASLTDDEHRDVFYERIRRFQEQVLADPLLGSFATLQLGQFTPSVIRDSVRELSEEAQARLTSVLGIRFCSTDMLADSVIGRFCRQPFKSPDIAANLMFLSAEEYRIRWHTLMSKEYQWYQRKVVNEALKKCAKGWSPMAAPIGTVKILKTGPVDPFKDADLPSSVVVEVTFSTEHFPSVITSQWDSIKPGTPICLISNEHTIQKARLKSINPHIRPMTENEILAELREYDPNLADLKANDDPVALELRKAIKKRRVEADRMTMRRVELSLTDLSSDWEKSVLQAKLISRLSLASNNQQWNADARRLFEIEQLLRNPLKLPNWVQHVLLGYGHPLAATPVAVIESSCVIDFGRTFSSTQQIKDTLGLDWNGPTSALQVKFERQDSALVPVSASNTDSNASNPIPFTNEQIGMLTSALMPAGLTLVAFDHNRMDLIAHLLRHSHAKVTVLAHSGQYLETLSSILPPSTTLQFSSKHDPIHPYWQHRFELLDKVSQLVEQLSITGDYAVSCASAAFFNEAHVKPAWLRYQQTKEECPFDYDQVQTIFSGLEELRPLELLGADTQRLMHLIRRERIVLCSVDDYLNNHSILSSRPTEALFVLESELQFDPASMLFMNPNLKKIVLFADPTLNSSISHFTHLNSGQSLFSRLTRLGVPLFDLSPDYSKPHITFIPVSGECHTITPGMHQNPLEVTALSKYLYTNPLPQSNENNIAIVTPSYGQWELLRGSMLPDAIPIRSFQSQRAVHDTHTILISICYNDHVKIDDELRLLHDDSYWRQLRCKDIVVFGDQTFCSRIPFLKSILE